VYIPCVDEREYLKPETEMKKLTKGQSNILAALRWKHRKDDAVIPMSVLESYDWRSVNGLFGRGLLSWDDTGRARLKQSNVTLAQPTDIV
jgi:hypothetical protein